MDIHILLKQPLWYTDQYIYVKGFIRQKNAYLRGQDLLNYFVDIDSDIAFEKRLKASNGQFAVIIKHPDGLMAACDHSRSIPLFYYQSTNHLIISDQTQAIVDYAGELPLNKRQAVPFLLCGFTLNRYTLLDQLYQIEAGQYIYCVPKPIHQFYHTLYDQKVKTSPFAATNMGIVEQKLRSVYFSHFDALNNRLIALPLTGGYDSRLIACLLKEYGYKNLLLYTYGRPNNKDYQTAQKTAKILNLPYEFIPYTDQLIRDFISKPAFKDYYPAGSNHSSMFYMQDYFAIQAMQKQQMIPEDAVIMPGHTGMLAGSHLLTNLQKIKTSHQLARLILKQYFTALPLKTKHTRFLLPMIKEKLPPDDFSVDRLFENWVFKEPQVKFTINSIQAYKHSAYDVIMPLLDRELIKLFAELPFEQRLNKQLYTKVIRDLFFKKHGISWEDTNPTIQQKQKQKQHRKNKLKRYIPNALLSLMSNTNDPIYYREITQYFKNDMPACQRLSPIQANDYNAHIIQWMLYQHVGMNPSALYNLKGLF